MQSIMSYEEWQLVLKQQNTLLLFVKTNQCSVCSALFPQVAALQDDYSFPFFVVNVAEVPEMAGQLSLFTAPVVLLFHQGKETARFARFVQMEQLKRRMAELEQWGEDDAEVTGDY